MRFALDLVLVYGAAAMSTVVYFASLDRFDIAPVEVAGMIVWVVLMIGLVVRHGAKGLWAGPGVLLALPRVTSIAALMAACASGSSSCF